MMQMILMFFMFLNAFLFTKMNHPMSMGIILLMQTLYTCLMTGIMSKSFWFSYILFLVFIGGMLILFMYMSSLASNEKLNFSLFPMISLIGMFSILILFIIMLDKFFIMNLLKNEEMNNNFLNNLINENILSISKMYSKPNNLIIILLVLYLLLTLIMVVKITNLFMGPLRPNFN